MLKFYVDAIKSNLDFQGATMRQPMSEDRLFQFF